ncbi:MAG: FAD-dependent oxidoreductase [Phycisphaerales bacterium]|nr:FAD-dependent oxidoreductase [Phycisphaerales bacterium]
MTASRREFIAGSLASVAGYSVLVDARHLPLSQEAAGPGSPGRMSHDGRRTALEEYAAQGNPVRLEPNMRVLDLECDVLVAGGGMAGVCAALAAARNGARTILVQDRSRLGGNASSEIKMHIVGADCHGNRRGWREGGLIEEIRVTDASSNPDRAYEMFDLMLYDKCVSEPNITLLLDTSVYAAEVQENRIREVRARCDKTETIHRIVPSICCDCTGDSRLALEGGAPFMRGREAKGTFGETLGLEVADGKSQGSSILFTAREHDRPMPWTPPGWARKIEKKHLRLRPTHSWEYGYWWIELGGEIDTIADNELIRFELLSIVLGVWDYIKNSGNHPKSANWALETVGMIPGKRESRRIIGPHIQVQQDLEGGWKTRDDGVSIGGWNFDDHPPEGFDAPEKPPFVSVKIKEPYNIAFDSLYSRDIGNLMMAGRNISNSHVAFTSTRVMATCACTGQAVGTAAAVCAAEGLLPAQLRANRGRFEAYRQRLLRDDQTIRGLRNEDPDDHARSARVTASRTDYGAPEHVIDGVARDQPGSWDHRWAAEVEKSGGMATLELNWSEPKKIGLVQLTFDTGFHRELTLSASDYVTRGMVRGPQPETLREYVLEVRRPGGEFEAVAEVSDNVQRLRRHRFDPRSVDAVRMRCLATNGNKEFRLYEIRCYA